ncbi:MAG: 30S ribosomal protein S12 methylthiotransferase RimO [Thermodesulfovibrio sp.]|uniref:30S ribosomal protein S12 methylthiotransferase RimO n=1 Tax=Thermodesulfovibrio sp. 1176 TaxID=3043424 RepID=UPI0024827C6F|nr:30S ribosomal protein S12 methylthiotransferase RimO [Thermodesulfovibrio sp. 1176]MDI1471354.1 30S ribosomal protein S12 methylthiotransferase RimO [Thermodesulfovibrio sp. 1176]MDI6714620.1 30S ribosomal protein S12 methylthiotransferase RimO [Thermodesulfovibrio sp.]
MKFTVITLGCPKNTVDSRHLIEALIKEGFSYVEEFKKADFVFINTCCFINDAKEESIDEILTAVKFKDYRKLIVFGCLSERYREEIKKEIPEIDALFGVKESERIIKFMSQFKDLKDFQSVPYTVEPPSYRYIKIADGCSRKCTFCVIPSIRGNFRSTEPEKILKEAESFVSSGVKELILVAQDITQYGKELKGYNLTSLLNDLCSISGDFWIRLLYLYPTDINQKLVQTIAEHDKIVKYLDIPMQHSEERILRLMGRRGTKKEYLRKIHELRQAIPEVILRSTFIVGFPTEKEVEFQSLVDFIEEVQFDRLGVFKYSKEEGTVAYNLKEQIPENVKQRRYDEIMSRQAVISLEKNRAFVGKEYDALIDYVDVDLALARLYCHAPEIDGVVILDNISNLKAGDKVKVLIKEAYEYDLKGVIVS